ncbi:MAG TPA: hypothetical protein DCK95_05640 [Anaerolineaceae bacterium]|nr:hypothetical protein [Anaerolineaceae bacterium]
MKYQNFITHALWKMKFFEWVSNTIGKNGKFVLVFHGIASRYYFDVEKDIQPTLTTTALDEILGWLEKRFDFLSPNDFFSVGKTGVLLTFDDGLASTFINGVPILEKYNAPAIIFVTTQHVAEPQNWLSDYRRRAIKQWGNLKNVPSNIAADFFNGMSEELVSQASHHPLVTVGSHTINHPFLTNCTPEQIEKEVSESKKYLEEITGKPVEYFAYPAGDYDRTVAEYVINTGYRAAFAVDPRGLTSITFEIPRIGLYQYDEAYLSMKMCGLYRKPIGSDIKLGEI